MFSVGQYLEMARECLREVERTSDPARRKALIEAAKAHADAADDLLKGIDAANEMSAKL